MSGWSGAEHEGRTEAPSAARVRAARSAGVVPRTTELPAAMTLVGAVAALAVLGRSAVATVREMLRVFLMQAATPEVAATPASAELAFSYLLRLVLPVAGIGLVAALAGNLVQVRPRLAVRPVAPDWHRIVPRFLSYFRRALFSAEAAYRLAATALKVLVIAALAGATIHAVLERLAGSVRMPLEAAGALLAAAALRMAGSVALLLLALAIADYLVQRRRHRRALRMTPREVREERRRQEPDPQVRRRLRARMRELLSRDLARQVAGAAAVITGGARWAVAVRWTGHALAAPVVVAKGLDEAAGRIRAAAAAHPVPLVERPQLARVLAEYVEVGDPVPAAYFRPLAEALARTAPGEVPDG